jgi:Zn-finger nucleic acid-binding protein
MTAPMTTSYRETALTCPACGEALDPAKVGDAIIDVCPACGGLWVDWFDGDLVQMVRGAPHVPDAARVLDRPGRWECPRCHRGLEEESYQGTTADVRRCADCAGVFVPKTSIGAVAHLTEADAPAPPPDALSKLARTLQRWLGWTDG